MESLEPESSTPRVLVNVIDTAATWIDHAYVIQAFGLCFISSVLSREARSPQKWELWTLFGRTFSRSPFTRTSVPGTVRGSAECYISLQVALLHHTWQKPV